MPSEGAVIEPVAGAAPAAGAANADWHPYVNDDLKADPVVSEWIGKASEKDIPGLIKGYAHLFKSQGNKIALPGKDAKPEDVAALKTKLYEAGVLTAPPATPKDYGILKPENLPEGLQWSDELSTNLPRPSTSTGVPKAALADLMPLYSKPCKAWAKRSSSIRRRSWPRSRGTWREFRSARKW
jgi:hypothetical protein